MNYNVFVNGKIKAGFNENQERQADGKWGIRKLSKQGIIEKIDDFITKDELDDEGFKGKTQYYVLHINGEKIKIRLSDHLPYLSKVENEFEKNSTYFDNIDYYINFSGLKTGGQSSSYKELKILEDYLWNQTNLNSRFTHINVFDGGNTRENIIHTIGYEIHEILRDIKEPIIDADMDEYYENFRT